MSWLSQALHGGGSKNPATQANQTLGQIPGQVNPYYKPYQEVGNTALMSNQQRYRQLLEHPEEVNNMLGSGYKQSPGYAVTLREALAAANNAAAMGRSGGLGTYGHEQLAAEAAGDVANKDYEQYLQHIYDLYGIGSGGNERQENQGYNANTDYAHLLAENTGRQAQYQYEGQKGINARNSQNRSNLFSGLSSLGTGALNYFYPGAGFALQSGSNLFGGGR